MPFSLEPLGIRIRLLQDSQSDLACGSTGTDATGTIRSTLSLSIGDRTFRNDTDRARYRGNQDVFLHGLVQNRLGAGLQPFQFAF